MAKTNLMIKRFLTLEWRAFKRSASFATNLALKIFMAFIAIYFIVIFLAMGIGLFYLIREEINPDPLLYRQQVHDLLI